MRYLLNALIEWLDSGMNTHELIWESKGDFKLALTPRGHMTESDLIDSL